MLDSSLFAGIALTRLRNRWVEDGTGNGYFRMFDRSAVRLTGAEWARLAAEHRRAVGAAKRRLMAWMILTIPAAVTSLYIRAVVLTYTTPDGRGSMTVGAWLFFGIMVGFPVLGMLQHVRSNGRALKAAERSLQDRPRCPLPDLPDRRGSNVLEMLALASIAPVIIQTYGTFHPDAFRNTPWTGMKLGLTGYAGIALLVLVGAIHLGRRLAARRIA